MTPLRVSARMAGGIGHGLPWGISLDGLLASQMRENIKADAREGGIGYLPYDVDESPPDLDLPLARCGSGQWWHWAATCAFPEGEITGPHVQYWSARPDQYALAQTSEALPAHVSERQGRYRSHLMPLPLTLARTLMWRAVGDPAAIEELLSGIASIGKKRGAGSGGVLTWAVVSDPDGEVWEYSHLHPDGTLGRPVPPTCVAGRVPEVPTGGRGVMGVRPPYMHPARRSDVLLPAK